MAIASKTIDLFALMQKEDTIERDMSKYSFHMYGQDGAGKTSLMYELQSYLAPNKTMIFGFEDRFKGLAVKKVLEFHDWKQLMDVVKQLRLIKKEGKQLPFDNVIIDTLGEAYKKCTSYVMDDNGWTSLQGDYGSRYGIVREAFEEQINTMKHLGLIVSFVSHDKAEVDKDENQSVVPDTAKQIKHLCQGNIDFIMYVDKIATKTTDKNGNVSLHEKRRLWLHSHPTIKLKVPMRNFPAYIEYEDTKECVKKFVEAFNKSVEYESSFCSKTEDVVEQEQKVDTTKQEKTKKELSTNELQNKAIDIRNKLVEKTSKNEMQALVKEHFGTINITNITDKSLLESFIAKYE